MAAKHDKTRFNNIKGYGSKALSPILLFKIIHIARIAMKIIINVHEPANFAILSAALAPKEYSSFLSLFLVDRLSLINILISSSSKPKSLSKIDFKTSCSFSL